MKRSLVWLCSAAMVLSLAACGASGDNSASQGFSSTASDGTSSDTNQSNDTKKPVSASSLEELEDSITSYVDGELTRIRSDYDTLAAATGSYDAYVANIAQVQGFYSQVLSDTSAICLQLRQYSIDYANLVVSYEKDFGERYDDMEGMFDVIYDDAADAVYDSIYDDLSSDLYDHFYSGVVASGYDLVSYDEWHSVSSEAYDMWSDTMSDFYDEWSDTKSDIYGFYSDVQGDLYDRNSEKFDEHVSEFQADVDEMEQDAA